MRDMNDLPYQATAQVVAEINELPAYDRGLEHVARHAWQLAGVINRIVFETTGWFSEDWGSVAEWLKICAGVEGVSFNRMQHDEDVMWCRPVYNFERARDKLHRPIILELTRFSYAWAALENAADVAAIDGTARRLFHNRSESGKVVDLCAFFRVNPPVIPLHYRRTLEAFASKVMQSRFHAQSVRRKRMRPWITLAGLGIQDVYAIRNSFAHGSLYLPLPTESDLEDADNLDSEIIQLSTRIVLLTIQMLTSAAIRHDPITLTRFGLEVDAQTVLRLLHCDPDLEPDGNETLWPEVSWEGW